MPDVTHPTKQELYERGRKHVVDFCSENNIVVPTITRVDQSDPLASLDACAWYRLNAIQIKVWACAHIGTGGMAWSYPGYVIDRTPYGVLAHELGHHIDYLRGKFKARYSSEFSTEVRKECAEPKLTNYCPDNSEWFAEMFRLFVTNSDLLKHVRPKTYAFLIERYVPVEIRPWKEVLRDAPLRTIIQASKKIGVVK